MYSKTKGTKQHIKEIIHKWIKITVYLTSEGLPFFLSPNVLFLCTDSSTSPSISTMAGVFEKQPRIHAI